MFVRAACAAIAFALLPVGAWPATVSYAPPAGNLPAGHLHGQAYSAVLPSGRLVTPEGTSVVTGMDTLGIALTPDGRYAIATNDDEREAPARSLLDADASGGYSLTVVDTATMTAVAHYRAPGETYFGGVVALKDPSGSDRTLVFAAGGSANAVFVFDLDASGRLDPDERHRIDIPGSADPAFADRGISFPAALLASADGRRIYAVDMGGDTVAAIDTASRRLAGPPQRVGFSPCGVAIAGTQLLVTNEGAQRYGMLAAPAAVPAFDRAPADLANASSLSLLALDPNGGIAGPVQSVPMDPSPDGLRLAGGAHPTAIVTTADAAYAFVAMTNVDRIATVALGAAPHVAGGTELRLFDRGPYGTQPAALALSRDGSRLYVALTGLDAVAVIDARDPLHLHRLGLIPTGWAPSAVALGPDDRTLYVANQKGFGHDAGFSADPAAGIDAGAVWSTLQRIDLAQVRLAETTRAALAATRRVVPVPKPLPAAIHNVVLIVEDGASYDDVLGDLGRGPGVPAGARYGAAVTPNLHALARTFGLAGNLFTDAGSAAAGQQIVAGGLATAFAERTSGVRTARRPLGFDGEDADDAPRLGTIFNALARRKLSFRDYGGFLTPSGTQVPAIAPPGLGLAYTQDAPAPAVLAGNVDLAYPARVAHASDAARAAEFVRDYGALAAAHRLPRFAYVALSGRGDGSPAAVTDGDLALGTIVAALSHLAAWRSTAVFVVAADAGAGRDHVDASRTFALVISPYAKRGYVGMRHLSTAGVLKTIDRIFGVPPLSLGDLLANDLGDFFTSKPNQRPYVAAPAVPGA
jgi:DNA-binding beta-propeller fold protein YncE